MTYSFTLAGTALAGSSAGAGVSTVDERRRWEADDCLATPAFISASVSMSRKLGGGFPKAASVFSLMRRCRSISARMRSSAGSAAAAGSCSRTKQHPGGVVGRGHDVISGGGGGVAMGYTLVWWQPCCVDVARGVAMGYTPVSRWWQRCCVGWLEMGANGAGLHAKEDRDGGSMKGRCHALHHRTVSSGLSWLALYSDEQAYKHKNAHINTSMQAGARVPHRTWARTPSAARGGCMSHPCCCCYRACCCCAP